MRSTSKGLENSHGRMENSRGGFNGRGGVCSESDTIMEKKFRIRPILNAFFDHVQFSYTCSVFVTLLDRPPPWNLVLFELAVEGRPADAEKDRTLLEISVGSVQRLHNQPLFSIP